MSRIFFVAILSLLTLNVYAADSINVISDDCFVSQGDTITVPVNFVGNSGIMGAKLSFRYPTEILTLKDISSGLITENGLFNTTVTDYYSVKGNFDVVWSSSENFYDDGSFVLLTFKVDEYAADGKYKIAVSYSQADTFDEEWNNVKLDCYDIIITVSDGSFDTTEHKITAESVDQEITSLVPNEIPSQSEMNNIDSSVPESLETTQTESETANSSVETKPVVSDDYMISSVELIADSFGLLDIDKASEEQANSILEFVNNRLEYYDENSRNFKSFAELREAYDKSVTDKAAADIMATVDEKTIMAIGDEVKVAYSVRSFVEISAENKEKAVSEFIEKLNAAGADTVVLQKVDNPNKAASVVDSVLTVADEQFENSEYIGQSDSKSSIIVASVSTAIIITLVVIGITVFIKRKKVAGSNKK